MEEFYQPTEATRTRTILTPARAGRLFRYNVTATARRRSQVNLLALAAQNGQTSTLDPTVAAMLASIRAATGTTGTISEIDEPPTRSSYFYQSAATGKTARADETRRRQPSPTTTG